MSFKNLFFKKDKPTPEPYRVAKSKIYAAYIKKLEELTVHYIDNDLGDKPILIREDIYNRLLKKSNLLQSGSSQVYTYENTTYAQVGTLFSLPNYQYDSLYTEPLTVLAVDPNGNTDLYTLLEVANFENYKIEGQDTIVQKLNSEIINNYDCYIDPSEVYSDYFMYVKKFTESFRTDLLDDHSLGIFASHIHGKKRINETIQTTLLKVIRYKNKGEGENKGMGFLVNTIKNLILHVTDRQMDAICTQNCPEIFWKKNKHKELRKAIIDYSERDFLNLIMETDDLIITFKSQQDWPDDDELEHDKVKIYKKDNQTIDFMDCSFESSSEGIKTLEMFLCGNKNLLTYTSFKFDIKKIDLAIIYQHDCEFEVLKQKFDYSLLKKIRLA